MDSIGRRVALLRSGTSIPVLGLGTWMVHRNIRAIIGEAVKTGFRHIDCAAVYENEAAVGEALARVLASPSEYGVGRSDLFVTSKLWCTRMAPEEVPLALEQTLKDLQLDYLDLYLMHWPLCFQADASGRSTRDSSGRIELSDARYEEAWVEMNRLKEGGRVRAIGVSNFTAGRMQRLIDETGIVPEVNQVELHPYLPQDALVQFCRENGVVPEAYSPLGSGRAPRLLEDQTVLAVAKDEGLTPAQVLLSWAIMRGTVPLVRTSRVERVAENFLVKSLSQASFAKISAIRTRHRYIDSAEWAGHAVFDASKL